MLPLNASNSCLLRQASTSLARTVAVCLLGMALLRCEAQNLVPNPSFEVTDTCPHTIGFSVGDRPLFWNRWDQSPEYFHACAGDLGGADTLVDVPWNGFTWQYAHDGDAYVGMALFLDDDFHELVGAPLLQDLVVGQTYYVIHPVLKHLAILAIEQERRE